MIKSIAEFKRKYFPRNTVKETCIICGKEKGQPPERCNGHYRIDLSDYDFEEKKP